MTRHLFKLVWNRRRTNAFLALEIFFSFLVLFGVAALGVFAWDAVRRPLGFRWENVWTVAIDPKARSVDSVSTTHAGPEAAPAPDPDAAVRAETLRHIIREVRGLREVESAAFAFSMPYDNATWSSGYDLNGKRLEFETSSVTDEFATVLGLQLVRGRFFSATDDGAAFKPVVVNERMARFLFGDGDPLGKSISRPDDAFPSKIVGVITDFRKNGELSAPGHFVLSRAGEDSLGTVGRLRLLVKLRPETPRSFEERLSKTLESTAREWSFETKPLEKLRQDRLKAYAAPLVTAGLVGAFLLVMVALGLTGVLWQSVTQRTREVGLRRAKGATARRISKQIVAEVWVLTFLAIVPGLVLALQLPLLEVMPWVPSGVWAGATAASVGLLFALTTVCALYPSRLATRVSPVEALHYE